MAIVASLEGEGRVRRKASSPIVAGLEEVVEGEGGEPMPTMGDTATVDVPADTGYEYEYGSSDAGSTTGVSTLHLEVDVLAAAAVDEVAREISRRVGSAARAAKITSVTVASPAVLAFLRLHTALEAEVASLEALADRFESTTKPRGRKIRIEDTTALALPMIAAAASSIPQLVNKASAVFKKIAATTAYSGRANRARQVQLDAALAKHLTSNELEVDIPERSLPASEPRGLVPRVLSLQGRCRQLQESYQGDGDLGQLLTPVDALVAALFSTSDERASSVPLAQQVMLADGIARRRSKSHALLFSEIVFSGGSYRTRKWLFNFLFGRDGLTYNGGAGVTYFLFRSNETAALDSDTIYFASPHGSFDSSAGDRPRATNIGGSGRTR